MIVRIYDLPHDPKVAGSIADPIRSAYLALVHLIGIRAITLDVRADVRMGGRG